MRSLSRAAAASSAVLLMLLAGAPAHAATERIADPAGDATQGGLDVTRAALDSRDRSLVVRVRFDRVRPGDLIVSVDPRGARGVRLVSQHRRATDENVVVGGAFSDPAGGGRVVDCDGFRVRWNADADRARMVLPSTCLRDGDYGAVRFQVLTEETKGGGGGDADHTAASGWVARG